MQSFLQWFIGEAGAGWIIGILGLIGGIYAWVRRERPPKIVIQESRRISLLDVHSSQSDKINVTYSDASQRECKIESLQQIELAIYNTGTGDISDPIDLELTFRRRDQPTDSDDSVIGFWKLVFDDIGCAAEDLRNNGSTLEQSVRMKIPYLNSHSTHNHFVMAYLMTEHPVQLQLVRGTGRGWSASLSTLDEFRTHLSTMVWVIRLLVLGLLCLGFYAMLAALLGSPVYGALYNPTPYNVDRLITMLTRLRESVQMNGVPSVWKRLFSELEFGSGLRLGWYMLVYVVSILSALSLSLRQGKVATWLTARLLRIMPPKHWIVDSEQTSRRSEISRILDGLK